MRICFINPNATASMTGKIAAAARSAAAAGTEIVAVTNEDGPPSIQGEADGEAATPGLLARIARHRTEVDAFVVACFDDTALAAARLLAGKPVTGIGEAAFLAAAEGGRRFSVVTTLSVSVPIIRQNIAAYGLASACIRVRASEVPVLALEEPGGAAVRKVSAEIERAKAEDRAEAIVLGCAGMADLAASLSQKHGLPVLDGVACAVKLMEGLVGLGLKTSKLGGYAAPLAKPYLGRFEADAL